MIRSLGDVLARYLPDRPSFAVADRRVLDLHRDLDVRFAPHLAIDTSEDQKSFAGLQTVLRAMAAAGLDRSAVLVALGGGVIGDLGGLAAALYHRGIDLVQVPTTLLSMVDSSVGGKTAINLPEGKNLVGALWPARHVLIDPAFVATLPDDQFRSGLGEVLKTAIGLSAGLFALLGQRRDAVLARDLDTLGEVIELSLAAKIGIVEQDPAERGPRRLLNLGHTLGHALEAQSGYSIPHGTAVARGLHFAIDLGEARGRIDRASAGRCRSLLAGYGFEATDLPDWDTLEPFLRRDKKVQQGLLHVVLPTAPGHSEIVPMTVAAFTGRDS